MRVVVGKEDYEGIDILFSADFCGGDFCGE